MLLAVYKLTGCAPRISYKMQRVCSSAEKLMRKCLPEFSSFFFFYHQIRQYFLGRPQLSWEKTARALSDQEDQTSTWFTVNPWM